MNARRSVFSDAFLNDVGDTPRIIHRHTPESAVTSFYDIKQSGTRGLKCNIRIYRARKRRCAYIIFDRHYQCSIPTYFRIGLEVARVKAVPKSVLRPKLKKMADFS